MNGSLGIARIIETLTPGQRADQRRFGMSILPGEVGVAVVNLSRKWAADRTLL